MRRKRIDWDEEIRQTEQIRWKGLRISIASFAMAALWIFGVGRMGVRGVSLSRMMFMLFLVGAGTVLVALLMRRRRRRRE